MGNIHLHTLLLYEKFEYTETFFWCEKLSLLESTLTPIHHKNKTTNLFYNHLSN